MKRGRGQRKSVGFREGERESLEGEEDRRDCEKEKVEREEEPFYYRYRRRKSERE